MSYCCDAMKADLTHTCETHARRWDCPDNHIHFSAPAGMYGLMIRDDGQSFLLINYCPWCGTNLESFQANVDLVVVSRTVTYPEGSPIVEEEVPVKFSTETCNCQLTLSIDGTPVEKLHGLHCPVMLARARRQGAENAAALEERIGKK